MGGDQDVFLRKIKWLGILAVVAMAYFAAGKFGLRFAVLQPNATAIWAPTGIAIAVFLLLGFRAWPAIFAAAFFVNMTAAGTVLTSLGVALGNTLEGAVAAYLVERFANGIESFRHPGDVFRFVFFAGVMSTAVSPTIGVTSLALGGFVPWSQYPDVWFTWWLGDVGGALIVAPLIILWFAEYPSRWGVRKIFEGTTLALMLGLFVSLIFQGYLGFSYLILPVFVWAAFRFGQREVATCIFLLTEAFLWGTVRGLGSFAHEATSLNTSLILLEISMATTFITAMALMAMVVEHRKTQGEMAAHNERMTQEKAVDAAIIASIGDGLVVTDRAGMIVLANPQAAMMLGCADGELAGKYYFDAISMQDEDGNFVTEGERPFHRVLVMGEQVETTPLTPTRYYTRSDGSRFPVSFTKSPVVLDERVIGVIEIFRDVTKGKEIDRAKSEFVSLASHQLRTPLSIISMYSELLRRQGGLFEKHDERECLEYAGEIQRATKRMADLINDLLNVSRIDAQTLTVAPAPVNIANLTNRILEDMNPRILEKQLAIRRQFADNLPGMTTDANLLEIIIQNLVSNAVKYTPPEGRILVGLSVQDNEMLVRVADNGYGIPAAQQGDVFKKLFRADNVKRFESDGTGLGLYIARSMVDTLGGSISFSSEEGKGTTFTVRLPLAPAAVQEKEIAWTGQKS